MLTKKIAIDMAEDWGDVNKEYEKLFGSAKRVNLFDTEEEYNELRKYIMSEPQETYQANVLPFENVEISIVIEPKHKQEKTKGKAILNILESLRIKPKEASPSKKDNESIETDKHLFFIKEEGICDASGYYNKDLKYFFISKDSLVSYDTDMIYMVNDTENARENFLNKICEEVKGYYRVIRDAKCRSASAAACYVLGYISDQTCWKDSEGRLLSDVYPDVFSKPIQKNEVKQKRDHLLKKKKETHEKAEQNPPSVESKTKKTATKEYSSHYYYIVRENQGNRSCNAKGTYDKVNDKFIIMSGSELAQEVTSSYRYTASDIQRKKFIRLNCGNFKSDFKLKRDAICNSPDEAASFVLGEKANGWVEWKSKDGLSLESYISKV